jgi:hypothetical protein
MDYMTEFFIAGIGYGIELEARGENLPEDAFVQREIERLRGSYALHRASSLTYSVASRASFEHALDLYKRMKEIRKDSEHVCQFY